MVGASDLALDHLTVSDVTPSQLAEVAAATGCRAISLFMEPMAVLPRMPPFQLHGDTAERRRTRAILDDSGVTVDLAYPFTLAGRTDVGAFAPAMETAACLGAYALNALVYDREPARRIDNFARFADLAASFGLPVMVEFYPVSQVRTLDEAITLIEAAGRPQGAGVNVDLLHLMRSGGTCAMLAAAPAGMVGYGQFCDGVGARDPAEWDFEASSQRLLPGQGVFDLAAFADALPADCLTSVELPQEDALAAGVPVLERARAAIGGVARMTGF